VTCVVNSCRFWSHSAAEDEDLYAASAPGLGLSGFSHETKRIRQGVDPCSPIYRPVMYLFRSCQQQLGCLHFEQDASPEKVRAVNLDLIAARRACNPDFTCLLFDQTAMILASQKVRGLVRIVRSRSVSLLCALFREAVPGTVARLVEVGTGVDSCRD
jgi:hypothetical protein